jgi:hypothetical protein
MTDQEGLLDLVNPRNEPSPVSQLIAASFMALFLELAMIRFVNSTVQVVAYFNNFLIISAFLGLGLGSALVPSRRDIFGLFPAIFCSVIGTMLFLGSFTTTSDLSQNVFWSATTRTDRDVPSTVIIILVFFSSVLFFIPLGFKLGGCLLQFENRLVAYSYDLAGSFLGVISFALASYLRLQPWQWFAIASLLCLYLLRPRLRIFGLFLMSGGILLSLIPVKGLWSPYYKITLRPLVKNYQTESRLLGWSILVDKLRIQDALNFGPDLESSNLAPWVAYYELPFSFRKPRRVLILGGGSGNDAAIALVHSPERVDVVEIDPVLTDFGFFLHPQRPYSDARTHAINDDARAYLRRSRETYDLIVMNALDSHHQLPGLSTLRLESYVYTVQAFEDVRRHMTSESIFVVNLSSSRPWMGERLYKSLTLAFEREPMLLSTPGSPDGSIAFVYGPNKVIRRAQQDHPKTLLEVSPIGFRKSTTRPATDDWPHLYLATNEIPSIYYKVLAFIVMATLLSLLKPLLKAGSPTSLHFLFLGAGFMLLETVSITRAALLFGSTWIVNAIVIASVLIVIFLGNLLVKNNKAPRSTLCWLGLFASLLANHRIPISLILNFTPWIRLILTFCWVGVPIFFASLLFSHSFKSARNTASLFGANLLGIVIGGCLEYSSMVFGLNSLYLLAVFTYALAMVCVLPPETL